MQRKNCRERIDKLKKFMSKKNVDGYILSTYDEYLNEYVPEYNQRLKWLTGFSGSNGLLLVIKNKFIFFTDGRYLVQAKKELPKKFMIIDLFHQNIFDWIKVNISNKKFRILIDSKVHSIQFILKLIDICKLTKNYLQINKNIMIDKVWTERPKEEIKECYIIPKKYVGKSSKDKLIEIKKELKKDELFLVTSSESIAWLLNLRGKDLTYTPLIFSRMLIFKSSRCKLFINLEKINYNVRKKIEELNIEIYEEDIIKKQLQIYSSKKKVFLERNAPYIFFQILKKNKVDITFKADPINLRKSIKNNVELKFSKEAHIQDGIALSNFFCWLENQKINENLNEIFVAKKLEYFRKKNKGFVSLSFPTISATGSNGSVIHYQPNKLNNSNLKSGDLFLCDSGGQYIFGTTDVTRTVMIGKKPIKKDLKDIYTRVLIGHLDLGMLRFPKETKGYQIDAIARTSLWQVGMDYQHGTGHGVGSFLSVHEGPQSISKANINIPLTEGMILSNEPGYYKENYFGIRIENLVYIKKSKIKGFLEFETLTLVPYARNLINVNMLSLAQVNWINNYHNKLYKKLSNNLNNKTKNWLLEQTKPI